MCDLPHYIKHNKKEKKKRKQNKREQKRTASLFHRTTFGSGWTEEPEVEPLFLLVKTWTRWRRLLPGHQLAWSRGDFLLELGIQICAWAFNLVTNKSGGWQSNFCCKVVEHTQSLFLANAPHQKHWLWRCRQTNLDCTWLYLQRLSACKSIK